jgi:hypothetical protein
MAAPPAAGGSLVRSVEREELEDSLQAAGVLVESEAVQALLHAHSDPANPARVNVDTTSEGLLLRVRAKRTQREDRKSPPAPPPSSRIGQCWGGGVIEAKWRSQQVPVGAPDTPSPGSAQCAVRSAQWHKAGIATALPPLSARLPFACHAGGTRPSGGA